MRIEITLTSVACYNTPTDFDAEIMFRTPTKSGQKVIKSGFTTHEEAQFHADQFVKNLGEQIYPIINEQIKNLKTATE